MAKKYLDYDGLLYFWQKIKVLFVSDVIYNSTSKKIQKTKAGTTSDLVTLSTVATSGSYNDLSNKPTIPSATSTSPKMDGTAAVGTETAWAKGDHVHPSDTSRVPTTRTINGKALSSDVTLIGDDIILGSGSLKTIKEGFETVGAALEDLIEEIPELLDGKVDKETGKGLSTNDYTTAEKNKLSGIASGAEVNVQSDWNQTTTTADDYIKNKPTLGAAAAKGVVTSISSDSTDLPTVTAVKGYVDTAVTGATAYQGIAPTTFAPTNYKAGWYWVIGTAGTYCGQICEAGDMIFCKTAASTYAAANFDVVQTNLDITSITNAEIDTIVAA